MKHETKFFLNKIYCLLFVAHKDPISKILICAKINVKPQMAELEITWFPWFKLFSFQICERIYLICPTISKLLLPAYAAYWYYKTKLRDTFNTKTFFIIIWHPHKSIALEYLTVISITTKSGKLSRVESFRFALRLDSLSCPPLLCAASLAVLKWCNRSDYRIYNILRGPLGPFSTLPFLSINLWTIKLPSPPPVKYGIYPSAYCPPDPSCRNMGRMTCIWCENCAPCNQLWWDCQSKQVFSVPLMGVTDRHIRFEIQPFSLFGPMST